MAWKSILQNSNILYILLSFSNLSQVILLCDQEEQALTVIVRIHHDNVKSVSATAACLRLAFICCYIEKKTFVFNYMF